jgi:hypothetical protein
MEPAYAQIALRNLHCHKQSDQDDPSNPAEPYLWVVFFKIDGDTTVITDMLQLEGTATVVPMPGNQRDLPTVGMRAGDDVAIPSALGRLTTVIKPIPLTTPIAGQVDQPGTLGCIAVLMEKDSARALDMHYGHEALNRRFTELMNALVPTLGVAKQEVTLDDIEVMRADLKATVTDAIAARWGILDLGRDWDDNIGSAVVFYSQRELTDLGTKDFSSRITSNGEDWELTGQATAVPVSGLVGPAFVEALGRPATEEELAAAAQTLRFYHLPSSEVYAAILNNLVARLGQSDGEGERREVITRSYLDIFGRAPFDSEMAAWFASMRQRPIPYRILVNEHLDWLISRVDPEEIERVIERSFLAARNQPPTRAEVDGWIARIVSERLGYRQIVSLL